MAEYVRGTKKDRDERIDFANMVFSMSSASTDFEQLLPKAFAREKDELALHHLIKEDGKIQALIDVLPITLCIEEIRLQAGYIGTVSVHPRARGRGHMITLMQKAEEQARAEGRDLLILDGNRQRYQHYGFEKAGLKYCFNLTQDSVRHGCEAYRQEQKPEDYRFVLWEEEENDSEWIDTAFSLYQKKNATARIREDFFTCLQSWEADTYAVLREDVCIGYLNVSADERNIFEYELSDIRELPFVLRAFMEEIGSEELGIHAAGDEPVKIDLLDIIADYYTLNTSHQIKILNYEHVLRFFLQWRLAAYEDKTMMQEGSFVIGVYAQGEDSRNYLLSYQQGKTAVVLTKDAPNVVFEEKELVKTLTTGYYYHALQKEQSGLRAAPQGWFPFPFFLPEADAF